ncbi:MAG: hypothetical protein JKX75_08000 [Gammaproteobacteria bacterium]|nr:hypothetical protein [Gammaproteobacteria bacterium]
MYSPFQKQSNDVLEKFRINAHLRRYVKEPTVVNRYLLQGAVLQLKKLPHEKKDPAESIAKQLVITAFCLGYYKYADLTDQGYQLVRQDRYRGYQLKNKKMLYNYVNKKIITS